MVDSFGETNSCWTITLI